MRRYRYTLLSSINVCEMLQLKYTKTLQLQRLVVQSIRNSDTLKSSIPQIYLKLQRLIVQSIRNSDTFEILYTSNIIKTAETGSPKYQKF